MSCWCHDKHPAFAYSAGDSHLAHLVAHSTTTARSCVKSVVVEPTYSTTITDHSSKSMARAASCTSSRRAITVAGTLTRARNITTVARSKKLAVAAVNDRWTSWRTDATIAGTVTRTWCCSPSVTQLILQPARHHHLRPSRASSLRRSSQRNAKLVRKSTQS